MKGVKKKMIKIIAILTSLLAYSIVRLICNNKTDINMIWVDMCTILVANIMIFII